MANLYSIMEQCRRRYDQWRAYDKCVWEAVAEIAFAETKEDFNRISERLLEEAGITVQAVGNTIEEKAVAELTSVGSTASEFIGVFDDEISEAVARFGETIDATNESIYETAASTATNVQETFDEIDLYIQEQAVETATATRQISESVIDDIDDLSTSVSNDVNLLTTGILDEITGLVDESQSAIRTDIDATVQSLDDLASNLMIENESTISEITDVTAETTVQIGDLSETLNTGVIPGLESLGDTMSDSWFMTNEEIARDSVNTASSKIETPESLLARLASGETSLIDVFFAQDIQATFFGAIMAAIQLAFSNVVMAVNAVQLANNVKENSMLWDLWANQPIRPFTFSEAVSLAARGHISDDEALKDALKGGMDEDRYNAARNGVETPLNVEQAINALHRGIIDDASYNRYLLRQAYNETDAEIIRSLGEVRPSVQDLVSMSVRDVFSPEVVSEFGLFDELPEEFVSEAGKSGLSPEWAEKYWGAHWRVPSANQGFEMLHRSIITDDQMDLLLKQLDVAPFWRDKFKQMAYRPVTRVDIRRMYKLGVIDENNVTRRHLDLGYSPDDAELMTQFVTSLVDDSELIDDIDPKTLTQAQIKLLYLQGTLEKQAAIDALIDSGYSSSASLLLVGSWETQEQIKDRETIIRMIINKAVREHMNSNQIESLIAGLDLTTLEREKMQREIALRSSEYPSIPSKSELRQMVTGGIITYDEWVNSMHGHGYSRLWIDRYAQLWKIQHA